MGARLTTCREERRGEIEEREGVDGGAEWGRVIGFVRGVEVGEEREKGSFGRG